MKPTPLRLAPLPYPLDALDPPIPEIWAAGTIARDRPAVAIVGSRDPEPEARRFASRLAQAVVCAGGIVISGGAAGIDCAAHFGAMRGGGRTICVAPTGCNHAYPERHRRLYDLILARGGGMIWPFPPNREAQIVGFRLRNRVLVALSDALVIAQADARSGALNAAAHARRMKRPVWTVAVPPWIAKPERFEGCMLELGRGARPVVSISRLLEKLHLGRSLGPALGRPLTASESAVLAVLEAEPRHADEIASRAALPAHLTTASLLTLALEDVVVEGPAGFFRRANSA